LTDCDITQMKCREYTTENIFFYEITAYGDMVTRWLILCKLGNYKIYFSFFISNLFSLYLL
jgi:hypothetical protein